MPSLETRNLTIRFGGHVAVNAVSCAFEPGTLTAIVGPNGAGKTTYFNLISGQLKASEGAAYYYFGIPKNPVNEWLVANHYKKYQTPPDFFTAGGMSAGIALVEALKKTKGDTNTDKLIATMEGMSFETPKGKMTFRKEDHQALQSMYHFKIKVDPAFAWGVPELVREIKPEEMNIPIRNKR